MPWVVAIMAIMATVIINEVIDAREAKNNFGALLDAARRRPITIRKHGRDVAVVLSVEEYVLFEQIEDRIWGERADAAMKKGGFLGPVKSAAFLASITGNARARHPQTRNRIRKAAPTKARRANRAKA